MSKFTGSLIIEEIKAGKLWKIKEPVIYELGYEGSGKIIKVPIEFITDGASIPWPINIFIAVWGTYGRAAVIHDYLYLCLKTNKPHIYAKTKKEADKIFLEAMGVLHTNILLKYIMYYSVRFFGKIR